MQLLIDGQQRTLIDIRDFRQQRDLPESFGVALFEPKDYTGLGSIEHAGGALNTIRAALLEAVPPVIDAPQLPALIDQLGRLFREKLYAINDQVELKDVEIEFAVAGFEDVNRGLLYALLRAGSHGIAPSFGAVYGEWLDAGAQISIRGHEYNHNGQSWRVQIINTAYGRAGLIVDTGDETIYLRDGRLACPAEGFMSTLLKDLAARIMTAYA